MAKRSRHLGFFPLDNMSGNSSRSNDNKVKSTRIAALYDGLGDKTSINPPSKKYKNRKDAKVIDHINDNSVAADLLAGIDEIPKSSAVRSHNKILNNINSGALIRDQDIESSFKFQPGKGHFGLGLSERRSLLSGKEIELSDDDEDNNLEPLNSNTSPMRKSQYHGRGLLHSSPITSRWIGNSSTYRLSGKLKAVVRNGFTDWYPKIYLRIRIEAKGCGVNFRYKEDPILAKPFNTNEDCKTLCFGDDCAFLGFIFKNPVTFHLVESNQSSIEMSTVAFLWETDDHKSRQVLRNIKTHIINKTSRINIEESMSHRQVTEVLSTAYKNYFGQEKESIATASLKEQFSRHTVPKPPGLFSQKSFNSLATSRRKHTSVPKGATKIRIPDHNSLIHEAEKDNPVQNIPATSFYSKVPSVSNGDFSVNNKNITLNVRRSSRRLEKTPEILHIDSVEEPSEPYEVPKEFKPTLHRKFRDGTVYTVNNQDFKSLYNNDWVNDSIIDFFVKFYVEKSINKNIVDKDDVYIMSSFFYSKLISDPDQLYENVKKWVQNADLFKRKYVVIPLNVSYHWFGCIISNLDEYLNFVIKQQKIENESKEQESTRSKHESDESGSNSSTPGVNHGMEPSDVKTIDSVDKKSSQLEDSDDISLSYPTIEILTFDSLRGTHRREVEPIKDFIIEYAKDKHNLIIDKSCIKMKTCLVPEQPNMSDCGVYLILTIEKFFEDPETTINVWRNAKSSKRGNSGRIVNEYFEKTKRNQARRNLRHILKDLQEIQIEKMRNEPETESKNDDEDNEEDLEIIEDINTIEGLKNNNKDNEPIEDNNKQTMDIKEPENVNNKDPGSPVSSQHPDIRSRDGSTSDSPPPSSPQSPSNGHVELTPANLIYPNEKSDPASPSSSPVPELHQEFFGDIPTERISPTKYLESSPIKYKSIRSASDDNIPIRSPFFMNDNEVGSKSEILASNVPELRHPIDRSLSKNFPALNSSPNRLSDSINEGTSQSIFISDADDDVNLVGEISKDVIDKNRVVSGQEKEDNAIIISAKVGREMHNEIIHGLDSNNSAVNIPEDISSNDEDSEPIYDNDGQGLSPLSEPIHLDDD